MKVFLAFVTVLLFIVACLLIAPVFTLVMAGAVISFVLVAWAIFTIQEWVAGQGRGHTGVHREVVHRRREAEPEPSVSFHSNMQSMFPTFFFASEPAPHISPRGDLDDELFEQAKRIVADLRDCPEASPVDAGLFQRRLKISDRRALKLMDQIEKAGIINQ